LTQLIVTTVQHPDAAVYALAEDMSRQLDAPYVPREQASLERLRESNAVDTIAVATKQGPRLELRGGAFFFHPSMAELRIKNLHDGLPDHMINAMALEAGMSVLDGTLGLATDAIVASYVAGPAGKITGIEATAELAYVVQWGLQHHRARTIEVQQAMARIAVGCADHGEFLAAAPDGAYDIVYFDPMFTRPIWGSSNMRPLRWLAERSPLAADTLQEARRVARRRIVIKCAAAEDLLATLGVDEVVGGRYSRVKFGIIHTDGR